VGFFFFSLKIPLLTILFDNILQTAEGNCHVRTSLAVSEVNTSTSNPFSLSTLPCFGCPSYIYASPKFLLQIWLKISDGIFLMFSLGYSSKSFSRVFYYGFYY